MSDGAGAVDRRAFLAAARLVEAVRAEGDDALRALTLAFDRARRPAIEVGPAEWSAGVRRVDPATLRALRCAARRIARFARLQKGSIRPFRHREPGIVVEQRLLPVGRVGVYVPGGRHPLCSTVLMGAIPARVAGCERVILCTPPRPDGGVAPEILAAARLAGVDRIFAVGGAQAIAAMAYGTASVPAVDLVVGPGNKYVTAAKSILSGRIGIDFTAGPSELLLIADDTTDPDRAAADLVAQAEHDPDARLWLVTVGEGVGARIARRARERARALPSGGPNRQAADASLRRMEVIPCRSLAEACGTADRIAPEHLSLQARSPRRIAGRLRSYGSLFLGGSSAVALGDYVTGPNHILPTAGAARVTGGLSVHRFLKIVTTQTISPRGARRLAGPVLRLARTEGLLAHGASVALRLGPRAR